jgi:hypothetical protein
LWGALSDERTGLSFVYAAAPASAAFVGSESLGTRNHILLSQIWDFPFRRLLLLAGSRWRYSSPPPHGLDRIHECAAFYNCHAAGIKVAMSNNSSVPLFCHGNAFVNIRCSGNKCLPSRSLARMTSASPIIPDFGQCLPSRCLSDDHILSYYSLLKVVHPNSLSVYHRSFFSEVSSRDVFLWLGFVDYILPCVVFNLNNISGNGLCLRPQVRILLSWNQMVELVYIYGE